MAKLNWGLLATGSIAKAFAKGVLASETGQLVAIGSRSQASADAFGKEFLSELPLRRHGSYEALLADSNVHAVYISTPHPMHAMWAIRACEAGKHVLCEKPLTLNYPETMRVVDAARRHNVFLMEAFMYRCHPAVQKLVDLLREGAIGRVKTIQANFAFQAGPNYESRLLKNDMGGGGILDVGCYPMSLARLVAGVATGGTLAEPTEVKAVGVLGPTHVDEYTFAVAKFPGDIVASLGTGVRANMDNSVVINGESGSIRLPFIWVPQEKGTKLIVQRTGQDKPEEIEVPSPRGIYALEADTVGRAVAAGEKQAAFPAMSWPDSIGNMRAIDAWRKAIGVSYEQEKPANCTTTTAGRKLARRPDAAMTYGKVPGVDKKVSRLVFGVDKVGVSTFPMAAAMFDDYFERGGNVFDCGYIYWGGESEKAIGHWMKNHNIRREIVMLDKGAHTPHCDPKSLTKQLLESLDRLQTDYLDIYMMHRDNPEIPVGEFADVLNEHKNAGRIHAFGGSNWSLERVDALNRYAKEKGLTGFAAVSNNFSLARMVAPPWTGCISSADAPSRAWFKKNQMALMPWSSQARGFFTDRAAPDKTSDEELVRCWYAPDNFQRQARARELARKHAVEPIVIALAYVLCQGFPTFPLIGPATVDETHSSMRALDVKLSAAELLYLNLEADRPD